MDRRRLTIKRHGRFYRIIKNGGICVYCGVRATTLDHFVPLSVVAMLSDVLNEISGRFLVPACGECNSIAGNKVFKTIAAKRRYIQEKLRKKYRLVLVMPEWTEEQKESLGWNMKTAVAEGLAKREWIKARLSWTNRHNSVSVELVKIRFALGVFGSGSVR